MSISSISGNGAFYSRPIKGREPISSPENNAHSAKRKNTNNEVPEQGQQGNPAPSNRQQLKNQGLTEDAFQSFAQRCNVDPNNKATNAYLNIGNYERQAALKQVFGIDIFV